MMVMWFVSCWSVLHSSFCGRKLALLFLLVLLLQRQCLVVAGRSVTPTESLQGSTVSLSSRPSLLPTSKSHLTIAPPSEVEKAMRVSHVRNVLERRHEYVISGGRNRDVSRWLGEQRADRNDTGLTEEPLFARDCRDLDLVETSWTPARTHLTSPNRRLARILRNDDDASYQPSFVRVARRVFELWLYHFGLVCSTAWLAIASGSFRRNVWYRLLSRAMGSAGAAFIKWGQWASTRHDMFPAPLCLALSTLHNEAPTHSLHFTNLCIATSLGIDIHSVQDVLLLDPEPLASGSIAQVYSAQLRTTSSTVLPVAVKVRHPAVAALIDMDFNIMTRLARAIETVFPTTTRWLHLSDSIQQFSCVMASQASLHVEAHHLELFNFNFRHWRGKVEFPKPIFASTSVIIESFEPGIITPKLLQHYDFLANNVPHHRLLTVLLQSRIQQQPEPHNMTSAMLPITQSDTTPSSPPLLERHELIPIPLAKFIVTTGVTIYLKMLLLDNLMHADLHPGNILVDYERSTSVTTMEARQQQLASQQLLSANTHAKGRQTSLENKNLIIPPLFVSSRFDGMAVRLVDAGMVAQLSEREAATFIGMLSAIGEGDGRLAAKFALQFAMDDNLHLQGHEKDEFQSDMIQLFGRCCKGYGTNVDLGEVLRGVLVLLGKHRVRVDANYATLVVNVLCVQGMAHDVCPEYNPLDSAKPLLQAYRRLCLTKDGEPIANRAKSAKVRWYLMAMYVLKQQHDDRFFQKLAHRRQQQLQHKLQQLQVQ